MDSNVTADMENHEKQSEAVSKALGQGQVPGTGENIITEEEYRYSQEVIKKLSDYFDAKVVGQAQLKFSLIGAIIAGHLSKDGVRRKRVPQGRARTQKAAYVLYAVCDTNCKTAFSIRRATTKTVHAMHVTWKN